MKYKVGYTFSKNWYKVGYTFFKKLVSGMGMFLKPRWHVPDQNLVKWSTFGKNPFVFKKNLSKICKNLNKPAVLTSILISF